ncbi:uncharacterized protein [Medicago truncatula]|uniref:uncharacterized protein n=1 Tax=Medicago truncatula TaxID=3880 RepID=UPI000D2F220C|nr:uncharacterized protein LOC112421691 [Medicago truncatula]
MDDSTNRNAIYLIEIRIHELEGDPTNDKKLIDELKSLLETLLTNPPRPPAAADSSLSMVDFLRCHVIYILKCRIRELKSYRYSKKVINEVEILLQNLLNLTKKDLDMKNLNSSLAWAAIERIKSHIDNLDKQKEDPTNKLIIRELEMLHEILLRYTTDHVDTSASEEMIEKICLVEAIVDLLSFASPEEHSLFNPDLVDNIGCRDPMLLLDENDLETIHQFVSKPDDSNNMRIRDAISAFYITANRWLKRNADADAGAGVHRVRLKKIISAIKTLEMESEKLSADNGQQSNSRDEERLKKSDEQQEKNSVPMGLPLEHDAKGDDAVMLE